MKMTKREQTLLVIAVSLLVVFVINKFIILPQISKISESKSQIAALESNLTKNQDILVSGARLDDQIESKKQEMEELSKMYFDSVAQEIAIWIINNAAENTKLQLNALSFNKDKQLDESVNVKFLRVDVPFVGDYFEVVKFVQNLKSNDQNVIIEKLVMNMNDAKKLEGVIGLGFYSLDNIEKMIEVKDGDLDLTKKTDPFKPFDTIESDNLNQMMPEGFVIDNISIEPKESKLILEDFEKADVKAVMGDNKGKCSFELDQNATTGRQSLKLNYNFPLESMNRTFVVNLEKERINITKPAETYKLNIYSYAENDLEISIRFLGSDNRIYENTLTNSIDWTGWKTLEGNIEQKYSIYPLRLQGIQIKLGDSAVGSGELLMDSLVAIYNTPKIQEEKEKINDSFTSYIVKKGDTLMAISRKFNGNDGFIDRVKKINHLKSNTIYVGKKLLIPTQNVVETIRQKNESVDNSAIKNVNISEESNINNNTQNIPKIKADSNNASIEAVEATQNVLKGMAEKINEGDDITTSREKQEEVINEIISDFMETQNN